MEENKLNTHEIFERLWLSTNPMNVTTGELRLQDKVFNAYYIHEVIDVEVIDIEICLN